VLDNSIGFELASSCRCTDTGNVGIQRFVQIERAGVMKFQRRRFVQLAAGAVALPVLSRSARAQTYPTRPLTIVVAYAAGGTTDIIARVMAERMRVTLGQAVVVENVTGAGGILGVARAARAAPDGYTICLSQNGTHVIAGATYPKLQYDPVGDFAPLSLVATTPFVISARKSVPAHDFKGFLDWLKANPGRTFATTGTGSITHIFALMLENITGIRLQYVPYRGTAPAMQDLIAGQIDILMSDPGLAVPQGRNGSVKVLAVADNKRLPFAPEIPTVEEGGLPGYHVALWHGLWMPKDTPKPIIEKLNVAVVDALADAAVQAKLAELGQEIYPRDRQTPEALAALQRAEIEKWYPIIKAADIRLE
jgi:tripartite-type tricarboxylate transporter receptor subunit TctC